MLATGLSDIWGEATEVLRPHNPDMTCFARLIAPRKAGGFLIRKRKTLKRKFVAWATPLHAARIYMHSEESSPG